MFVSNPQVYYKRVKEVVDLSIKEENEEEEKDEKDEKESKEEENNNKEVITENV